MKKRVKGFYFVFTCFGEYRPIVKARPSLENHSTERGEKDQMDGH